VQRADNLNTCMIVTIFYALHTHVPDSQQTYNPGNTGLSPKTHVLLRPRFGQHEQKITYNSTTNSPMMKRKIALSCKIGYLANPHIVSLSRVLVPVSCSCPCSCLELIKGLHALLHSVRLWRPLIFTRRLYGFHDVLWTVVHSLRRGRSFVFLLVVGCPNN
jgi:hypothetical protein